MKKDTTGLSEGGLVPPGTEEEIAGDNQPVNPKIVKSELDRVALLQSLKAIEDFNAQIECLVEKLQGDRAIIENNRALIFSDLTTIISQVFISAKVCFFGSSATGLAVQGSDVDIYLSDIKHQHKSHEVEMLKMIKILLLKSKKFCDVLFIGGAKVPIIKCIHTATQMCCDLNIKNKLAVKNSDLIKYYMGLDSKLPKVMMFLKFWAEQLGLKKVSFFSGYAVSMLFIFYCQQKFKFPSVRKLQEGVAPDIVHGSNCNFRFIQVENQDLKDASIMDIVKDFFYFYANFDYFLYVVCPYIGSPILKINFLKPMTIPPGYVHTLSYQPSPGFSIQDPFEHCRDISPHQNTSLLISARLALSCNQFFEVMSEKPLFAVQSLLARPPIIRSLQFEIYKPKEINLPIWLDGVKILIGQMLKRVLCFQTTERHETDIIWYHCTSTHNIFFDRVRIAKHLAMKLDKSTTEIDTEIAITDCIKKYAPQKLLPIQTFELCIRIDRFDGKMKLTFTPKGKSKPFAHFAQFLRLKLMKYIYDEYPTELYQPVILNMESLDEQSRLLPPGVDLPNEDVSMIHDKKSQQSDDSQDAEQFDDDVPSDFFDDFADENFMHGLDIIDVCEDDSKKLKQTNRKKRTHSPTRQGLPDKRTRRRSSSLTRQSKFIRRDPVKTKRDIDRDKLRCAQDARDKEQRTMNDKLKLVETGLIPPGMETEVPLETFQQLERNNSRRSRSPQVSSKRRSRDYPRRRSNTPESRYRGRHSSRGRDRYRRRNDSRDDDRDYRRDSHRSSSRKYDDDRKRKDTFLQDLRQLRKKLEEDDRKKQKEKRSFLEEIRDKLNEVRPPPQCAPVVQYNTVPYHTPHPVPVPAPVPGSHYFNPALTPQYDQNFFIGDNPGAFACGNSTNTIPQGNNTNLISHEDRTATLSRNPLALTGGSMHVSSMDKRPVTETIDKLFADKKISLSDFLTIAAKTEVQSSSPEHLQKKIKVISRCQDVIKLMSNDSRGFCVNSTMQPKEKEESLNESPLRRIPIVRFQFTSPAKLSEEYDSFDFTIDKLLRSMGMNIQEPQGFEEASLESFPDPSKLLQLTKKVPDCEECRKRKIKQFEEVATQTFNESVVEDRGVQITEEDLMPIKSILKKQSMASLTPAQLLSVNPQRQPEPVFRPAEEPVYSTNMHRKPERVFRPPDEPFHSANSPRKTERQDFRRDAGPSHPPFHARGGFRKPPREERSYNEFEGGGGGRGRARYHPGNDLEPDNQQHREDEEFFNVGRGRFFANRFDSRF